MTENLVVDDLTLSLRRSPRRKTLELLVDRDGTLRVTAPEKLPESEIAAYVREKRFWLYSKMAEKELLRHPANTKEYVSGEGFHYLGRRYRLLLVAQQDRALMLNGGRFRLKRSETQNGRDHFIRWFTTRGRQWLQRRVPPWSIRLGVNPSKIDVRDLGYRWGSCGKKGALNFHWATIQAPPALVDYVIVHELAHLIESNHTPEFWLRVERAMPDFQERRSRLAETGTEYWL